MQFARQQVVVSAEGWNMFSRSRALSKTVMPSDFRRENIFSCPRHDGSGTTVTLWGQRATTVMRCDLLRMASPYLILPKKDCAQCPSCLTLRHASYSFLFVVVERNAHTEMVVRLEERIITMYGSQQVTSRSNPFCLSRVTFNRSLGGECEPVHCPQLWCEWLE